LLVGANTRCSSCTIEADNSSSVTKKKKANARHPLPPAGVAAALHETWPINVAMAGEG
jgi:hypothetical protein